MLESQKRGFVPPPEYLHLQHQHQQSLVQTAATPHLTSVYSAFCHPAVVQSGFFQAASGEERARSTTSTSPDGRTTDPQGYGSGTAASPPTPPVTPGNRHQLPSHQQQQLGHMTSSVSLPGIQC